MTVVAAHQDPEREQSTELRESVADVAPNVGGLLQEIAELRHKGIEVDEDNDPAPENAQPSVPATHMIGQWVILTICPGREDVKCHNTKGVWRQHSWQKKFEMTELSLFSMAFPAKWVRDVLIPATNEEISGDDITLKEFYVYLGCHFFVACFEGISDQRLWWSPKPVSIHEGAPIRMQKNIALRRFKSITYAMRFTNKPYFSFLDRFHDVRQMINNFNVHYLENYTTSWLSCLGELMNLFWTSSIQGS